MALIDSHGLRRRVHERGGTPEVRFLAAERCRVLPVWLDGQLQIVRWGCRRVDSRVLPCTAWTRVETVQAGGWAQYQPQEVIVPASMGLAGGIWFAVRQGVRGVAVRDESGRAVVYPMVEAASHYFQVMTRAEWMPCLIGERI